MTATSVRGPLDTETQCNCSLQVMLHMVGLLAGDSPWTTMVQRIQYSNDAVTASVRGPLTHTRNGPARSLGRSQRLPQ